ncbi:MAG: right-handed parallel beta-helix repeat-containing protein [Bacteroidetes bacterium]|nr:right-handed parallel beta-helix repeat-containing protein [Bacteroidota bacterium]
MRTLVLLCLLLSSQHGFSKTIFVDPNSGKSHSSGTLSSPLKTLDEAVKIANASVGNAPLTILLFPGLYTLTERLDLRSKANLSTQNRYTLEAYILPDDTAWKPEKMPVITSVADTAESWGFPCSVGLMIATNHVTLRGLKFTGNPHPNHYGFYYPVGSEDKKLEDLEITQCLFIGDRFSSPVQCGILAHGNSIVVDHCVFYNCRNAIVYWKVDSIRTNCAFTHNLVVGAYQSAVWTAMPDSNFQFHNNVIAKSNFGWIKNYYNPAQYTIENCVFSETNHIRGEWQQPDTLVAKAETAPDLKENNVLKNAIVQMAITNTTSMQDEIPVDYMSLVPGSPGEGLNVGLFLQRKK